MAFVAKQSLQAGRKLPWIGALALVFVSGCAIDQGWKIPDPTPVTYTREELVHVVEALDDRRNAINTVVAANLKVTLWDSVKKKDFGLTGHYLGDKDGSMRLKLIAGEATTIMDMAIDGDTVEVWLPRTDKFYRGKRADISNADGGELALLANIGNAHDLFFPRAWTEYASERRLKFAQGKEVVSVLERSDDYKCVRRVGINREQPVADWVEVFDRRGHPLGTVSYDDYRFPDQGGLAGTTDKDAPPRLPHPGRIALKTADGSKALTMELTEGLELNGAIDRGKFKLYDCVVKQKTFNSGSETEVEVKIHDLKELCKATKHEKGESLLSPADNSTSASPDTSTKPH